MNHDITLVEYFAAHDAAPVTLTPEAVIAIGMAPGKDEEPSSEWAAQCVAKIRFIRARAMAEEAERIRSESIVLSPEQQRQTDEVTRMFTEQSRDMKMAAGLDRPPGGFKFESDHTNQERAKALVNAAVRWTRITPAERDRVTAVLCRELGIEKEYREPSGDGRFLDFLVRWHMEICGIVHKDSQKTSGLSFSEALVAMNQGKKVKRQRDSATGCLLIADGRFAWLDEKLPLPEPLGVQLCDIEASDWETVP